jgi:hypothetical protein
MPRNSKNQGNSVNQGDPDDIKRQSNISKNKKDNVEKIKSVGKGPKQYLGMKTKIKDPPSGVANFCCR